MGLLTSLHGQAAPTWGAVAAAGLAAGFLNAIAGGGSLLSIPALMAAGLPALIANTTNSIALSPGYGGAALAQRRSLAGQGVRLARLLPVAALGGLLGGLLLLISGERLFRALVPWLILLGSLLLALQEPWRQRLQRRQSSLRPGGLSGLPSSGEADPAGSVRAKQLARHEILILPPVLLASIYGGYFGAGQSVILLAVLGIALEESLPRLNGLKQALALTANLSAALLFAALGRLDAPLALALGLGSLLGGALGGRLVDRLNPRLLRGLVVIGGVVIALLLLVRR